MERSRNRYEATGDRSRDLPLQKPRTNHLSGSCLNALEVFPTAMERPWEDICQPFVKYLYFVEMTA